jgi:Zn-dependent M16 (insulinase) family peptidase
MDTAAIAARLVSIRDALASSGMFLHLTVPPETVDAALAASAEAASAFSVFGPPKPANRRCADGTVFLDGVPGQGAEVWASPSLQIGFAAASLPAAPYGSREQAAELVLSHELSTGALWESIRMKGGAYGASARPDSLEGIFSLSTYRDPCPVRSLQAFPGILAERGGRLADGKSHEKALIGTFARETAPRTPSAKGFGGFLRYLYGITEEHRFRRLEHIVSLEARETSAAASRLARGREDTGGAGFPGRPVVIAGTAAAEEAAAALGTSVRMLPV